MPWHDARYRGYGLDKVQFVMDVAAHGYAFRVMHDSFAIHRCAPCGAHCRRAASLAHGGGRAPASHGCVPSCGCRLTSNQTLPPPCAGLSCGRAHDKGPAREVFVNGKMDIGDKSLYEHNQVRVRRCWACMERMGCRWAR